MKTDIDIFYSESTPANQVYSLKNYLKRSGKDANFLLYRGVKDQTNTIRALANNFSAEVLSGQISLPLPFNYIVATWTNFPNTTKSICVGFDEIMQSLAEV